MSACSSTTFTPDPGQLKKYSKMRPIPSAFDVFGEPVTLPADEHPNLAQKRRKRKKKYQLNYSKATSLRAEIADNEQKCSAEALASASSSVEFTFEEIPRRCNRNKFRKDFLTAKVYGARSEATNRAGLYWSSESISPLKKRFVATDSELDSKCLFEGVKSEDSTSAFQTSQCASKQEICNVMPATGDGERDKSIQASVEWSKCKLVPNFLDDVEQDQTPTSPTFRKVSNPSPQNFPTKNVIETPEKDAMKIECNSLELTTLHEYLSRRPLHDQSFWERFDEIFETAHSRRFTVTDLNILVTVYEKLNLVLFEERDRPTLAVNTSDISVLADNLFCSVTPLDNDDGRAVSEVTPCWSSLEQYHLSAAGLVDFVRLQSLMALSATCLLINARKGNFGAALAYCHLVKASYDAVEHMLRQEDAGELPITAWQDRVHALLSYAYYKLYLQQDKWLSHQDSYQEVLKLTESSYSDAKLLGAPSTAGLEWPKSWQDLLMTAKYFFSERVSLTAHELWRSAAIATLCLNTLISSTGGAEKPSKIEETLEALQRFSSVQDPILQAVLTLKKFQFCYGTEWKGSSGKKNYFYSEKNLEVFQQVASCLQVHHRALKIHDAPSWVMVRFRSQLLLTVINHVIRLVSKNDKEARKVSIKILEDFILEDFLTLEYNADKEVENAPLRLAMHSIFYFLTEQMSGRPPSTQSAICDGRFALAVYSKVYLRRCVASDVIFTWALQPFEAPIAHLLTKDNGEKALLRTLFLMMPMIYEKFQGSVSPVDYTPKRFASMSWLEIADDMKLFKAYHKLRKVALTKAEDLKKNLSIKLLEPKEFEKNDPFDGDHSLSVRSLPSSSSGRFDNSTKIKSVQREFGSVKAEDCSSCHFNGTLDQSLETSMICIDGQSTPCRGIRGTLYIRDSFSDPQNPSFSEAPPETVAFVTSFRTESYLNNSLLEDEIIGLNHTGNHFCMNCAPVCVIPPENFFLLSGNENNIHDFSSIGPSLLESSRIEVDDDETLTLPNLESSALSASTFNADNLNYPSSWSSVKEEACRTSKSTAGTLNPIDENKLDETESDMTIVNEKQDKGPVSASESEVFLSNALAYSTPIQIQSPLDAVRAALFNSLLRITESKDWVNSEWIFVKCPKEKFEAATKRVLNKGNASPLQHLVEIFDHVASVMGHFLLQEKRTK